MKNTNDSPQTASLGILSGKWKYTHGSGIRTAYKFEPTYSRGFKGLVERLVYQYYEAMGETTR